MLSELALVDWVALLIALVLLGVAGVAAYLSSGSGGASLSTAGVGSDTGGSQPATGKPASYAPNHAFSTAFDDRGVSATRSMPAHAASTPPPMPVSTQTEDSVFNDAPAPPILTRSSAPDNVIDMGQQRYVGDKFSLRRDPSGQSAGKESVADRAARLRNRPVSELEARVAVVDDKKPDVVFASSKSKLSVGMETAEGFIKRAPGFFTDPVGRHELRYWNGRSWTEYVKEGADRFIDPM